MKKQLNIIRRSDGKFDWEALADSDLVSGSMNQGYENLDFCIKMARKYRPLGFPEPICTFNQVVKYKMQGYKSKNKFLRDLI